MNDFWDFVFKTDGWADQHIITASLLIMVGGAISFFAVVYMLIGWYLLVGLWGFWGAVVLAAIALGPGRLFYDYRKSRNG